MIYKLKKLFTKDGVTQFVKFGFVGASNTVVSLGITYLFILVNPRYYLIGNTLGWLISVLNSFFWNRKFVFKNHKEPFLRALVKTYTTYGASFLVGLAIMVSLVEWLHVPEVYAPLIKLIITIPINYLIHRFWIYKS